MARSNGILGPWEIHRKLGLAAIVLVALFLFVILYLPVGFVALGILIGASSVWKPVGVIADPTLGTYMINTFPFKVAAFFTSLKAKRPEVLTPVVALGFGPAGPDRDHGLEPGWLPPTRLSAYWSLVASLILGSIDILAIKAHYFVIPGVQVPWFIVYPLSVVGFLAFFQVINAIRRIQGDNTSVVATEPKPAVMIHKSRAEIPFRKLIPRALAISSAPVVIFALVAIIAKWPIFILLIGVPALLVIGTLISGSVLMGRKYIEAWEERNARREYWMSVFGFMRDKTPILADEVELPTIEEFEGKEAQRVAKANRRKAEGEEAEEARMYEPQIKVAIFQFPPNSIFSDYVGMENRIKGLLGVEMCAISPIGNVAMGAEVPGTIGSNGFRVWWSEQPVIPSFLDTDVGDWMREFVVRSRIIPALASIRGIGYCTLLTCGMITRADSEKKLIEVKVQPPSDVNLEAFLNNLEQIRSTLDVPWLRIGKLSKEAGNANAVSLFIGDFPEISKTKFVNPQSVVRRQIDTMDWAYYFNAQGLRGVNGTPSMVERRPSTDIVDKLVFRLPDGMPFEAIPNKKSPLMSTSGYIFMEIEQGDEDTTKRMSETEKIQSESQQEARFTLIASKQDPLKRVFNFGDYKEKILFERTPGKERINWFGGVMADDSLAEYSWDSEEPHLLIAGSSGSGKALDVDTPIFTTRGWKRLGDITVGNSVYDINGAVTKVIHAFDEYQPEFAYTVTIDDGDTFSASGSHLWSVLESSNRYNETRAALSEFTTFDEWTHPQLAKQIATLRKMGNDLSQEDSQEMSAVQWNDKSAYFRDASGKNKHANEWEREANAIPKRLIEGKAAKTKTKISAGPLILKSGLKSLERIIEVQRIAFDRPRFDSMGSRVMSVKEIAELIKVNYAVIETLVNEIKLTPTAKWHFPKVSIPEDSAGIQIALSDEEDLYSADVVFRHIANAYGERELDIERVSPELTVLNTAEIAESFFGVKNRPELHYAIPFRSLGSQGLYSAGITGDGYRHAGSHRGNRYISDVVPLTENIPMMRCISVASTTRTYRAGKSLIPTHNSVVSSSMILQLAHNNAPTEAVMWMIEPKTEMQVYRNIDVVERFVDSWSPDDNFMANAADLMEDAVAEMERRNRAFIAHPKQPKKLSKAREIAVRESEANGTNLLDHPLYFPFMFVILEECATLFADAASKEEKMEQGRLLGHSAELARKARSSGIYIIALTQYPTNASIPSVIRNQMRRIGLKCQNDLASRIVIGENGLEKIKTKGVGMLSVNGAYRAFRGFWVKDGDPDENEANDILDIIAKLPQKGSITVGAGGQAYAEVFIPEPSSMVFNAWDAIVGSRLAAAIEDKKSTKDVTDKDVRA